MLKKLQKNIKKYKLFRRNEKLVLAVSGGIDSVVLLDVFCQLSAVNCQLFLIVAHLNHGLRGRDSDLDQKFVKELAKKYHLPFETKKIDVKKIAKQKKGNLEEIAREERYKFLSEVAKKYKTSKIVTAHHADDQVETVLLNYLRGAAPQGLSGMNFLSKLKVKSKKLKIVRPLLSIWREEIEDYQQKNNLNFRQDKTNFSTRITRNYLRLKAIPKLEEQDKNFKKKIWQKSLKLKDLLSKIEPEIEKIYEDTREKELSGLVVLNLSKLKRLKDSLLIEILKKSLSSLQKGLKNISEKHIISLLKTVKTGAVGKTVILPGRLQVVVDYDSVVVLEGSLAKLKVKSKKLKIGNNGIPESGLSICLSIGSKIKEKGFNFDLEKIDFPVFVRSFTSGDSFKMKGLQGTKKLQDLFVDLKIPQRLRMLLPIIVDRKGKILGILGVRQSSEAQARKDTGKILAVDFEKLKI